MSAVFSPSDHPPDIPHDEDISRLRIPPHSVEAEQSVLGGLLIDNSAWDRAGDLLVDDDFYRFEHRLIYAAIAGLINGSKPADVITVYEQLQSLGKANEAGGLVYLNALAQSVPSAANLRRYAEIVRERAVLRKLIATSDEIATAAFNPQGRPVSQLLDEAEGKIFRIGEEGSKSKQGFVSMDQLVVQLIDRVNELHENGAEEVTGVRSGFYDLDRMTAGLQPGDLIVLAARPSMGKAQPLDARVRTRGGWKTMGELAVGDALASVDGRPSIVTGVYPQGVRPVLRLRFSDGRSTEACAEHLWRVHCRHWREPRVLSTAALQALLAREAFKDKLWIDQASGEFGHDEPLPLDPWLLGCLLGSGDLAGADDAVRFVAHLPQLAELVAERAGQGMAVVRAGDGYCLQPEGAPQGGGSPLREALAQLALRGVPAEHRFIPRAYLEAGPARRLDLLRGLLDTDGWIERWGSLRYATASRRLADDVAELVRSLGGWCTVTAHARQFVCHIVHPQPRSLFLLSDKQLRAPALARRPRRLVLSAIEPSREAPCRCISVSHPDRLYITDGDIVTHNTAFALNIGEHVAVNEGLPVVVFSMEMGAAQLALRMVGSLGRIDQSHLRTGKLADDEWGRLSEAVERLGKVSMYIDETAALSPSELRARARRQARQCGQLGLIVVDYLQLMSGSGGASEENRATVIGEISRGLKSLAKELRCPVIALSQLNRSVEARTDKRPMMSDLRESGAIEQDADVIMFIYRDEYYTKDACKEPGVAEIIIAKQRNGPTGTCKLTFLKPLTKFDNLAPGMAGDSDY